MSNAPTSDRRAGTAGRWAFAAPALVVALALAACAPGEGAPDETMPDEAATAEEEMAAVQEAPACQFRASGEELTGRASPPDSATAEIGGQTARLCYGAPSMRGRQIVGELVPLGQPWRMGANEPTTLHLPVAAEIGGVAVEPGSYSLYAIPGESEWTIVVNSAVDRWGIPINDEVRAADVGSFTVQPETLDEPVERLSITMEPAESGAHVVVEWETTRVSFPIRPAMG